MSARTASPPWTWGASVRLVAWSLLWCSLVLPFLLFEALLIAGVVQAQDWTVGDGSWWDLNAAAGWALLMAAFAVVPLLVGAAVAVPLVKVLGSALRGVRHPAVHVVASALLAGALAAVPVVLAPELWAVLGPPPVAAAGAAALARSGGFWWPGARGHPSQGPLTPRVGVRDVPRSP
jgi:hypothetical protein